MKRTPLDMIFLAIVVVLAVIGIAVLVQHELSQSHTHTHEVQKTPDLTVETESIGVTSPVQNASVTSPFLVTGQATGSWFFEGQFSATLYDANDTEIGQGVLKAQGDWMTTEKVPFSGMISFNNPTTSKGKLVLEKANPSGLEENAESVTVPVQF